MRLLVVHHHCRWAAAAAAVALLTAGASASAQDRLTSYRTVTVGLVAETVDFGAGLAQSAFGGSSVVAKANQVLIPVSLTVPLATDWTVDVGSVYSTGRATFQGPASGAGSGRTATLSGAGDVRLRLSGKLAGDALIVTLGANLPTGIHDLDGEQIAALGVFAAPALGVYVPAVSSGPSQTVGVVTAHRMGEWSYAAGLSYERRGSFSPVAALVSGLENPRFDPGDAIHVSLGADRFLGEHSLSVTAVADFYGQDELAAFGTQSASDVKLGPTVGVDAVLRIASRVIRDPTLYFSDRARGAFSRDGERTPGSSANYLSAGARGALPLSSAVDLSADVQLWHQSGISAGRALVTAGTTSGSATMGLDLRSGAYSFSPFVRVRQGSVDTGVQQTRVRGFSVGTTLARRF